MAKQELNVGIVGAGIGGVMASIAIARAGGKVTVLEAAHQLGEIGAGIQMVCLSFLPQMKVRLSDVDAECLQALNPIRYRQIDRERSRSISGAQPAKQARRACWIYEYQAS